MPQDYFPEFANFQFKPAMLMHHFFPTEIVCMIEKEVMGSYKKEHKKKMKKTVLQINDLRIFHPNLIRSIPDIKYFGKYETWLKVEERREGDPVWLIPALKKKGWWVSVPAHYTGSIDNLMHY
jgi:hypothetical protein